MGWVLCSKKVGSQYGQSSLPAGMQKRLVPVLSILTFLEYLFRHSTALLVAPNGVKTLRSGFKNTLLPMSTLTPQWQGQHSMSQLRLCYHILSARQPKIYLTRPILSALFGTLPRTVVNSLANMMTSIPWAQRLKLKPRLLPTVLVSNLSAREVTTQSSYSASGYCPNVLSLLFWTLNKVNQVASADSGGFRSTRSDPVFHYHSVFDSERFQEVYADPGFVKHVCMGS